MDPETQNIFLLGLVVLFGWMIVVLICASPQLFRDYIVNRCCYSTAQRRNEEKIKMAEARLQATLSLAEKPSAFLIDQVVALSAITSAPNQRQPHSITQSLGGSICIEMEEGSVFGDEPGPSSA